MSQRINLLFEKRTTAFGSVGFVLLAVLVWVLYLAMMVKAVSALDVQMECATESTGKTDIDSRYQTFDPAGSEKSYLLSVFGDGTFSYAHRSDGGMFTTDLSAEGTVGAEEKIGLNLLGVGEQSDNAFESAAGFGMHGQTIDMHSVGGAEDETLSYDVEASGDGRYQSEAFAEAVTQASDERRNELLTGLHLDLCPFETQEESAAAAARELYEYSESGGGVFSHAFGVQLRPGGN